MVKVRIVPHPRDHLEQLSRKKRRKCASNVLKSPKATKAISLDSSSSRELNNFNTTETLQPSVTSQNVKSRRKRPMSLHEQFLKHNINVMHPTKPVFNELKNIIMVCRPQEFTQPTSDPLVKEEIIDIAFEPVESLEEPILKCETLEAVEEAAETIPENECCEASEVVEEVTETIPVGKEKEDECSVKIVNSVSVNICSICDKEFIEFSKLYKHVRLTHCKKKDITSKK